MDKRFKPNPLITLTEEQVKDILSLRINDAEKKYNGTLFPKVTRFFILKLRDQYGLRSRFHTKKRYKRDWKIDKDNFFTAHELSYMTGFSLRTIQYYVHRVPGLPYIKYKTFFLFPKKSDHKFFKSIKLMNRAEVDRPYLTVPKIIHFLKKKGVVRGRKGALQLLENIPVSYINTRKVYWLSDLMGIKSTK